MPANMFSSKASHSCGLNQSGETSWPLTSKPETASCRGSVNRSISGRDYESMHLLRLRILRRFCDLSWLWSIGFQILREGCDSASEPTRMPPLSVRFRPPHEVGSSLPTVSTGKLNETHASTPHVTHWWRSIPRCPERRIHRPLPIRISCWSS